MTERNLLAAFGAAAFGFVCLTCIWSAIRGRSTLKWPTVKGQIISSDVELARARLTRLYEPTVTYTYSVAGSRYDGDRLFYGDTFFYREASARARIAPYPIGASVDVRYRADDPRQSVLEPGVGLRTFGMIAFSGIMFALVALSLARVIH